MFVVSFVGDSYCILEILARGRLQLKQLIPISSKISRFDITYSLLYITSDFILVLFSHSIVQFQIFHNLTQLEVSESK